MMMYMVMNSPDNQKKYHKNHDQILPCPITKRKTNRTESFKFLFNDNARESIQNNSEDRKYHGFHIYKCIIFMPMGVSQNLIYSSGWILMT